MLYINKNKLIKALYQVKENQLSLENIKSLFEKFADTYFLEGYNMILTDTGDDIDENTIYRFT